MVRNAKKELIFTLTSNNNNDLKWILFKFIC